MSAISLGTRHCCVCAGACWHVGGIQLCPTHERTSGAAPSPVHPVGDDGHWRERNRLQAELENWRRAYARKVEDFANETRRTSALIVAIQAEGHRAENGHSDCRLCLVLAEVGAIDPAAASLVEGDGDREASP